MPRRTIKTYDVIVIGGGSAGIAAAEAAAATGALVCIIEREALGGDCPHWACVPTKALLRSAVLYDRMRHASEYGIHVAGLGFSFRAVAARRSRVVHTVTGDDKRLFSRLQHLGVDVIYADAHFVDAHTIKAGKATLSAKAFVVATGATDVVPPIAGIEDVRTMTSRDAVQLRTLPASILVIGGGPVGAEFATLFALFGSKVTLIEAGSRILPREDGDIATLAAAGLRGNGVQLLTDCKVLGLARDGRSIRVTYQHSDRPRKSMTVAAVLVAAGRRPRLHELGLLDLNLVKDRRGNIALDDMLRTSAKHIFLAGDVTSGYQFTHVAHRQGTFAGHAAAGKPLRAPKTALVVPRVTFVVPEVASVGMTEAEARKVHDGIRVAKFPVGALSRAVIDGERDGVIKIIIGARGRILGGHMIGERAGEVVHELALAMHAGIPFETLASMLHAFPTYSEAIPASADYVR